MRVALRGKAERMGKIDVSRTDGLLTLTLANAAEGNRLDATMDSQFLTALRSIDTTTRAILLRAEGVDFCLGRASPMPPRESGATAADLRRLVAEPILELYAALRQARVPVVAFVQGRALGVGAALVACADFAIAASDATFAVPELDRDIPPLLVMTAMHGRVAPAHLARLVLMREPLSASEALAIGLVAETVPPDELQAAMTRTHEKLCTASPLTLQTIKRFAGATAQASFEDACVQAADMIALALAERYRNSST
jgi:enoyl-CoA hydratase